MAEESALYQLMKVRMNGVMNGITNSDREFEKNLSARSRLQQPLLSH